MIKSEEVCFMPDGTNIEYTVCGSGPKLLLIHGSQRTLGEIENLIKILSERFTVYCADRRGWGASGAKGRDYSMKKECGDAARFLTDYGIEYVFGDDYGAVIALHLALCGNLKKIILFEPYLTSFLNLKWLSKAERQIKKGNYFGAMVTYAKGACHKTKYVPGFLLKLMFKHSSFSVDPYKQLMIQMYEYDDPRQQARHKKDIESGDWKQKKRMLQNISAEINAAKEAEPEFSQLYSLASNVLIICERGCEPYVSVAADKLSALIPNNKKITVDMSSDEKNPSAPDFIESVARFISDGRGS
jgi:pimeloyl-ACP methyl ester carboxylesterase